MRDPVAQEPRDGLTQLQRQVVVTQTPGPHVARPGADRRNACHPQNLRLPSARWRLSRHEEHLCRTTPQIIWTRPRK